MRQFVSKRFGIGLSRSACLNYLHRLGFVLKRPKKRLVKADEQKREAFVAEYATLSDEAWRTGAKIFIADEAHFRADAELRGKWVLKGEPAPRFHGGRLWWTRPARAMAKRPATTRPSYYSAQLLLGPATTRPSYYSAVCLETGEVEWMDLEGNSNSGTSAAFLERLRQRHSGPLNVIWDNAPAHRGEAVREYLRTPGLGLRLMNPRFHEGRLCRATARTEAPMRPSGAGRERKPPETCAWEPRPW